MIIDAEVHLLHPEAINSNYAKYTSEPVRRYIYEHPDFPGLTEKLSIGYLLKSMNHNSISHALIMGMPWNDSGILNENNYFIEECVKKHEGKFKGLFIPDLSNQREAIRQINNIDNNSFIGVKLIPSWQGIRIDDDELKPLLHLITERNMFLMVHTDHLFQSLDGDVAYRLYQALLNNPKLKVLAPHMGGLLCLYGGLPFIKEAIKNVIFITSVSATMYMVEFAAKIVPDNIIFGTDFPFNHSHDQSTPLQAMDKLDLHVSLKKDILGEIAEKLFGFGGESN